MRGSNVRVVEWRTIQRSEASLSGSAINHSILPLKKEADNKRVISYVFYDCYDVFCATRDHEVTLERGLKITE